MAIAEVKRVDSIVEIYDEHGARTGVMSLGSESVIKGFTSTVISVQISSLTYLYDEKGQQVGVV